MSNILDEIKKAHRAAIPINHPHTACDLWTGKPLAKHREDASHVDAANNDATFKLKGDSRKRRASIRVKAKHANIHHGVVGASVAADDLDADEGRDSAADAVRTLHKGGGRHLAPDSVRKAVSLFDTCAKPMTKNQATPI
jgi:hypothetical protein